MTLLDFEGGYWASVHTQLLKGLHHCVLVVGFEHAASHLAADDVRHLYSLSFDADIEGMTGELSWYPGVKGDYSDLVETVMKRSDVTMFDYIWTLGRLTSYLTMVQAIEKAGVVDRERVKEALFKGTFKSPAGDVTFDEKGFPNTGAFTVQMQNGKVNVVWPPEVATGKLIWPSPTWQQ